MTPSEEINRQVDKFLSIASGNLAAVVMAKQTEPEVELDPRHGDVVRRIEAYVREVKTAVEAAENRRRDETVLDLVLRKQKKAAEELLQNINASLEGKPLPFPPPRNTCPHCGKEIE